MTVAVVAGDAGGIIVVLGGVIFFSLRRAHSRMPTDIAKKLRQPGDVATLLTGVSALSGTLHGLLGV